MQRRRDDRPVILVSTSHALSSFAFVTRILGDFEPIDRQRNQNGQQHAQVKVALSCDTRKMLQHLIAHSGRTDDAWRGVVNQNGTGSATDRRRENDVRVSDENVGQT